MLVYFIISEKAAGEFALEKIDFSKMTTEARNPDTFGLAKMSSLEIVTTMNREDAKVPEAISQVLPQIAKVVDFATQSIAAGARLIYAGAGTSGRLGVLDAVECPPTFGVDYNTVVGLIAGGDSAFVKAKEGAEDSPEFGRQALIDIELNSKDTLVAIAASGRTPYCLGALEYANELGCNTASISCNRGSAVGKAADVAIEVPVGPEVLTGSTRLKAGTCQKLILNMISTASMVRTGHCYENLMVDVKQSNEKLIQRAQRIVVEATGCSQETAKQAIEKSNKNTKAAVVMVLANVEAQQALEALRKSNGHVSPALEILSK